MAKKGWIDNLWESFPSRKRKRRGKLGWIYRRMVNFQLVFLLVIPSIFPGWSKNGYGFAEEAPAETIAQKENSMGIHRDDGEYHTPLAGEPFHTIFFGHPIDIPRRDRCNQTALELGGTLYTPNLGDTAAFPILALYLKRMRADIRLRVVGSGFVNEVDVARSLGNFELLGGLKTARFPLERRKFRTIPTSRSFEERGTLSSTRSRACLIFVTRFDHLFF